MKIDTSKEADEWFEHNPADKKVYFVLISEDDIINQDIDIDNLDVLKAEKNPNLSFSEYICDNEKHWRCSGEPSKLLKK